MSIVVSGASGFVGASLLPTLVAAGHRVVALDRQPLPSSLTALPGVYSLHTELSRPNAPTRDALREAQAVVHLAGCPGVRDNSPDVAYRRQRDNVDAICAVLESTPADTPVIVMSSSSVYGGTKRPAWTRAEAPVRASHEDDVLHPRGGYAASKVATEQVCRTRAESGGHVLVVRPFTVLGEGQRLDMAVARWAAEAAATGEVTILGSPQRTRDLTDVRDVCTSLIALLNGGFTGTVNLGTGRPRTLADLASAVCAAVGVAPRFKVVAAHGAEVAHTRADTARLLAWSGSAPQTDLAQVVNRSVATLTSRRVEHQVPDLVAAR